MSSGHRHDIINDHHSDMNIRRIHSLADALRQKHSTAIVQLQQAREHLQKVEANIPNPKLIEWKGEEAAWLKQVVHMGNHKDLPNPYEPRKEAAPSQKEITTLGRCGGGHRGEGAGMLGAVEEGVALDNLKFSLLADLTSDDGSEATKTQLEAKHEEEDEDSEEDDTSASQATVAPKKRKATATAGRARQAKAEGWDEINAINIELPSAYSPLVLAHPSMRALVDLERQVRQGQANDALADTRTHLITAFSFRYQRRNVSGQIQNTRAMRKIQRKQQATCVDRLRQVDDACYRVLKTTDVVPFAMYTEEEQLGDSRKTPSWIWEDFTALQSRWHEEVLLLEEEMRRTVRTFRWWRGHWEQQAEQHHVDAKTGEEGYARKQADRYSRLLHRSIEAFTGKIRMEDTQLPPADEPVASSSAVHGEVD
ncbi:hypothetical protein A0H81_12011 [Grifola frondosa]|uniref:Uncharacterized protein n=1 Tax=Grifola frondosa TaxID=5627 RepID=A0A1C7LV72_GRIFR|nr:hypothetical protein A0H81_12011 [Grifola frondosa]